MKQLVTIVLTTYKRPIEILERAVTSVLNQSYENLELLVINDYPEDMVLSEKIEEMLCGKGDKRIRYIAVDKNGGACKARNLGLRKANGTYIAFMDDDDEWVDRKLERQVKVLDQNPGVGLVYSSLLLQQSDGTWLIGNINPRPESPIKELLANNYIGPTSSPLLRTDLIRSVDGFDELMPSCQDYDLWMRVVLLSDIAYIDIPLVRYYYSTDSTFKGNGNKYYNGILRMFDKYMDLYTKYPESLVRRANNQAIDFLFSFHNVRRYLYFKSVSFKTRPFAIDNFFCLPKRVIKRFITRVGQKRSI